MFLRILEVLNCGTEKQTSWSTSKLYPLIKSIITHIYVFTTKKNLPGHPDGSMEDPHAGKNVGGEAWPMKFQRGMKMLLKSVLKATQGGILEQGLAALCSPLRTRVRLHSRLMCRVV